MKGKFCGGRGVEDAGGREGLESEVVVRFNSGPRKGCAYTSV